MAQPLGPTSGHSECSTRLPASDIYSCPWRRSFRRRTFARWHVNSIKRIALREDAPDDANPPLNFRRSFMFQAEALPPPCGKRMGPSRRCRHVRHELSDRGAMVAATLARCGLRQLLTWLIAEHPVIGTLCTVLRRSRRCEHPDPCHLASISLHASQHPDDRCDVATGRPDAPFPFSRLKRAISLAIVGNTSDLIQRAAVAWLSDQHDAIAGDLRRSSKFAASALTIRAGGFQATSAHGPPDMSRDEVPVTRAPELMKGMFRLLRHVC